MLILTSLLISMRNNSGNPALNAQLIELLNSISEKNTLDLSHLKFKDGNSLLPEDIKNLLTALESTTITRLDLSRNKIDTLHAIAIADAFKASHPLTALNLEKNSIDFRGAIALANALETNKKLRLLNLNENDISLLTSGYPNCKSTMSIINMLKKNNTLKVLDLRNNDIHVSNLIALIQALTENFTLTQFIIGEEAGFALNIHTQIVGLSDFIRTVDSRLLFPPLLTISQKPSGIIDQQYSDKPFSSILPAALTYHKNTLERQTRGYGAAIAEYCPIKDIALTIGCYLSDPPLQSSFLLAYNDTVSKKNQPAMHSPVLTPIEESSQPAPLIEVIDKTDPINSWCCNLM